MSNVTFKVLTADTERYAAVPVPGKNYSSFIFPATIETAHGRQQTRIEVFSKYAPAKFTPGTEWTGQPKQDAHGWLIAVSKRDNPALDNGGGQFGGGQRQGGGGYAKPATYTAEDFDAMYAHAVDVVRKMFPELKVGDDAFSVALGNYVNNATRCGVKAGAPIAQQDGGGSHYAAPDFSMPVSPADVPF